MTHIITAIAGYLEAPQYQVALWDGRLVNYFHSHPHAFEQFHKGSQYSQFGAWMQAVKTVATAS